MYQDHEPVSTRSIPTLPIDSVSCATGARIGLTQCPGGPCVETGQQRSLAGDLQQFRCFGAELVVSLIEAREFTKLGVPQLARTVGHTDFHWLHLPVPDMGVPGDPFFAAWDQHGKHLIRALKAGRTTVIHCAAGLGRTGLISASLLAAFGETPQQAIQRVRIARPGTIGTPDHEQYVDVLCQQWRPSI